MKLIRNISIPTSSTALKTVNMLFDTTINKISQYQIDADVDEIIEGEGLLLLPGGVDINTHFLGSKEFFERDINHATALAISGGWTTLAEMSYYSERPIFDKKDIDYFEEIINQNSWCDLALWGQINIFEKPFHVEMAQLLWNNGVVGLTFFNPSPNPLIEEMSYEEIMDLLMDIFESDVQFTYRGFDQEIYHKDSYESLKKAYLSGFKKILRRIQENPLHIPNLVYWDLLELLNSIAKKTNISYSIPIPLMMQLISKQKLNSTPSGFSDFFDQEPLIRELLGTNKIYMLSNEISELRCKTHDCSYLDGYPVENIEYSITWILSELWQKKRTSLANCIKLYAENPAKRLGLYPKKGSLYEGADADFIIVNTHNSTNTNLLDENGDKVILTCAIDSTWLRGEKVYNGQEPLKKMGCFLRRQNTPKKRTNVKSWI